MTAEGIGGQHPEGAEKIDWSKFENDREVEMTIEKLIQSIADSVEPDLYYNDDKIESTIGNLLIANGVHDDTLIVNMDGEGNDERRDVITLVKSPLTGEELRIHNTMSLKQ
jgi:hypothetical protein